jgi:hypothetical protein
MLYVKVESGRQRPAVQYATTWVLIVLCRLAVTSFFKFIFKSNFYTAANLRQGAVSRVLQLHEMFKVTMGVNQAGMRVVHDNKEDIFGH